jgi:glycosyltransferase involved in cell wall biosynthesis
MISVVIPHLNQPWGPEACLCSLEAQNLSNNSFEVLVVDNGSNTPPSEVVTRQANPHGNSRGLAGLCWF